MSERGLVVHQGSLEDIETALTTATDELTVHLAGLLDRVDTTLAGWTDETPSRIAQRDHDRRLREGITRLTEALASVASAVASHREAAREAEVENVAIVG